MLGWTGKIYEEILGDDKYTFVEDPKLGMDDASFCWHIPLCNCVLSL